MWDGEFVFCVSRDVRAAAARCRRSCCRASTSRIPAATSAELAKLLPGVEVLTDWRGPEHLDQQLRRVLAFLDRHTPKEARAKAA